MTELKVIQFPPRGHKCPVKSLRMIADQIEAGDFGDVTSCGVVIFGDTMDVFGSGEDGSAPTIALILNAGALRLAKAIEGHGQ